MATRLFHAMCGRFTQSYTWRELVELYRLTVPARNLRPRYNIAPTTTIDVLRLAESGPELVPMRWVSFRAGGKRSPRKCPRRLTLGPRPLLKSRCSARPSNAPAASCQRLAITSGAPSDGAKQPYFISAAMVRFCRSLASGMNPDPATGETISSTTLIVTAANDFTRSIHDRMPVFLGQCDHDAWLTGKAASNCCGQRRTIYCTCGQSRHGSISPVRVTMTRA